MLHAPHDIATVTGGPSPKGQRLHGNAARGPHYSKWRGVLPKKWTLETLLHPYLPGNATDIYRQSYPPTFCTSVCVAMRTMRAPERPANCPSWYCWLRLHGIRSPDARCPLDKDASSDARDIWPSRATCDDRREQKGKKKKKYENYYTTVGVLASARVSGGFTVINT